MTGIGGDCFVLVGHPDGRVEGLNGSGRSSARADADWLAASGLSEIAHDSVHAVTVPGAIDAWARLLAKQGTFGLARALEPAIRLAEQGCPVDQRVAWDWAGLPDKLALDEGARRHYLPGGRAPQAGDIMRYPALAKTLRTIARDGRDGFYSGKVAADIVATLAARGGLITLDDLAATDATWVDPISTVYSGRELLEIPPNGTGITALIALNALSHFDLGAYAPDSVVRRHLEIEAIKLAWVLRNRHVADSDQAPAPIDEMLSDATARQLAGMIDMDKAFDGPEAAVPMARSDTVYLTVVDKDRMAVSFINSLYDEFGAGIVTPETGITLQSRGAGFVTTPGHPNCIAPSKRPLHTIIPPWCARTAAFPCPSASWAAITSPWATPPPCSTAMSTAWTRKARSTSRAPSPSRASSASRTASATPSRRLCASAATSWSAPRSPGAAARRSPSTMTPASCRAAPTPARTGWRWDTSRLLERSQKALRDGPSALLKVR